MKLEGKVQKWKETGRKPFYPLPFKEKPYNLNNETLECYEESQATDRKGWTTGTGFEVRAAGNRVPKAVKYMVLL